MWLRSFIKKLLATNTIWGGRATKLAGIQDNTNWGQFNSIQFFAATNTIIAGPATSIPKWLPINKYFRFTTVLPTSLILPLTPVPATNNFNLFRLKSISLVSGNLVIEVDPSATGVDPIVNNGPVVGYLDSRTAVAINNPNIAKLDLGNNTVYNLDNNSTNGRCDGSGVGSIFANHYHLQEADNVAVRFKSFNWVGHHIEVIRNGVPGVGQIGPHELTTANFQYTVWQEFPDNTKKGVDIMVRVDNVTGSLHLRKAALAPNFDGMIVLEAAWKVI